jgi:hypothetical protein
MCFEGTRPPVLVVGDDIGSTANELETAFAIGKNLTYALAEHSMAAGFERTVLKHIYTAAVRMFYPAGIENTSDENLMALALRLNKKLSADDQDVLGELLEFYASRQRQASVSRWLTSIELTANHAGLLACMDLTAAIMALQNDPFMKSSLPKRDQAEELILYAIGEEFATLREQLNRSLSE